MSLFDGLLESDLLAEELRQPMDGQPSVERVKEIYLAIRTDGTSGDGTRENPFRVNTADEFDTVMRFNASHPNITIHLGPGLFRTRGGPGYNRPQPAWSAFPGQRMVGAGMFNTTLRVTAHDPIDVIAYQTRTTFAVGIPSGTIDNFEISDLTIDCNIGDQPLYVEPGASDLIRLYPAISIGAIGINGRNNRIRRVRVINFGTRTPLEVNGTQVIAWEAFILFNRGPGAITEDCILEQPFLGCGRETTIGTVNGEGSCARNNYIDGSFVNPRNGFQTKVQRIEVIPGSPNDTIRVWTQFPHNVCKKRHTPGAPPDYIELKGCAVPEFNGRWAITAPETEDANSRVLEFEKATSASIPTGSMTIEQSFQPTLRITEITWASDTLTVTTAGKHWRKAGDWVAISGCDLVEIAGVQRDIFNGTYQVASTAVDNQFTVTFPGSGAAPTGEMWLDRRHPFTRRIEKLESDDDEFWCMWGGSLDGFLFSEPYVKVTTRNPHMAKPGEWLVLGSVPKEYNSYFRVTEVLSRTILKFEFTYVDPSGALQLSPVPAKPYVPAPNAHPVLPEAGFGYLFQGFSCNGDSGATLERNRFANLIRSGDYLDTWAQLDSIVRKNWFYNIYIASTQILGGEEPADQRQSATITNVSASEVWAAYEGPAPFCHARPLYKDLVFRITQELYDGILPEPTIIARIETSASEVTTVGPVTTFKFPKNGAPFIVDYNVGPNNRTVTTYICLAQQRRAILEDNLYDVAHYSGPVDYYDSSPPAAILVAPGDLTSYPPLCRELIVRRNFIRPIDNRQDPRLPSMTYAVTLHAFSCASVCVENNIINKMPPPKEPTIRTFTAGLSSNVRAFNNQTNAGVHVRMNYEVEQNLTYSYLSDLYDESDDWLLGF